MAILTFLLTVAVIYRLVVNTPSRMKKLDQDNKAARLELLQSEIHATSSAKWYRAGEKVSVRGHNIPGGLIYVGEKLPNITNRSNDACLIDPELNAPQVEPSTNHHEIGDQPHYSKMLPICRGTYLQWLTDGRSDPNTQIGYVFLYFFGLERRLFIDGQYESIPASERAEITQEVNRLLKIYGKNTSFYDHANGLLATEWALHRNTEPLPTNVDFSNRYCLRPFQFVLAKYMTENTPIPADIAFQWINLHPEYKPKTPPQNCINEFRELFFHKYNQYFDSSLVPPRTNDLLRLEYHSANPSIGESLALKAPEFPNPFTLTEPLDRLNQLIVECIVDLAPYRRFISSKGNTRNPVTALTLLPEGIVPHSPAVRNAYSQLTQACAGGLILTPLKELYTYFGKNLPEQISNREAESLAVLLEKMGFGMAPDIRFHGVKLSINDKVGIFPHAYTVDSYPSGECRTLSITLRLSAAISQVDDNVPQEELTRMQSLVNENKRLPPMEKISLLAFLQWCLNTPQDRTRIKRHLSEANAAETAAIRQALVDTVLADRLITPQEITYLKKAYTALGLDAEQVTSDLRFSPEAEESAFVGQRDTDSTFPGPPPSAESGKPENLVLDEELIRFRSEETQRVKGILENIFVDQDENQDQEDIAMSTPSSRDPMETLDEAHQDLFHRLTQQESWERSSLHELCKELGLMLDGAMEILNEWSYDNADAPLIEDGDPVFIDLNLAKEILNAH